jgi:hypothetical protein
MQPAFNDYVKIIYNRFEAFTQASEAVKQVGRRGGVPAAKHAYVLYMDAIQEVGFAVEVDVAEDVFELGFVGVTEMGQNLTPSPLSCERG